MNKKDRFWVQWFKWIRFKSKPDFSKPDRGWWPNEVNISEREIKYDAELLLHFYSVPSSDTCRILHTINFEDVNRAMDSIHRIFNAWSKKRVRKVIKYINKNNLNTKQKHA